MAKPYDYMDWYEELIAEGFTPDEAWSIIGASAPATPKGTGYGAKARASRGIPAADIAGGIAADAATDALLWSPITKKKTSGASTGAASGASKIADAADDVAGAAKSRWFKPGGTFDKASGKLAGFYDKVSSPELDWSKKSGLQAWGKNIGGMYNVGNAAVKGYKAIRGMQDMSKVRDRSEDLMSDIVLEAANSPTIWYDLNADQRDLLRKLQSDSYSTSADISDVDLLGVLGDTAMGALTGLPGGIPGAIIGGLGGAANSVIGDLASGVEHDSAELEALYQAVLESERYHNEQRKRRAYAGLY